MTAHRQGELFAVLQTWLYGGLYALVESALPPHPDLGSLWSYEAPAKGRSCTRA